MKNGSKLVRCLNTCEDPGLSELPRSHRKSVAVKGTGPRTLESQVRALITEPCFLPIRDRSVLLAHGVTPPVTAGLAGPQGGSPKTGRQQTCLLLSGFLLGLGVAFTPPGAQAEAAEGLC